MEEKYRFNKAICCLKNSSLVKNFTTSDCGVSKTRFTIILGERQVRGGELPQN